MKKPIRSFFVILLVLLLLTACGQQPGPIPTEPPTEAPTEAVTEQPTAPAEVLTLPAPPEPAPINWLSALEPAPEAPEGFEIGAVLEYLCSTAFGGRQTGTDGCVEAGKYLQGFLEEWGYQPLFGDSLSVPYTATVGDPVLAEAEIILHFALGDIQLTEGVDFTYTFHTGDIDTTLPITTDPKACEKGEAVLLWGDDVDRGKAKITLMAADGVINSGSDIFGNGNTRLEDRRITLSDSAFALAERAESITLRMKASAKEMERDNICGVLSGADRTKAMVLCGHFDGTGTWGDILYPSAHDNASGTVTLLQCARQLAGEKLPFDLVICAFSGEEQKLLGSKALAPMLEEHYELINVINLDCLGCGDPESLKLTGKGAALGEALWPWLQQAGYTAWAPSNGSSDQDSFTHPAIGLVELPAEGNRFHQPNDSVDMVDPLWLQRVADTVCAYVRQARLITREDNAAIQTAEVPEEETPEAAAVRLEARRLLLAGGLDYDKGICDTSDRGQTALFTGWRMLNALEEVGQYYPELELPETVDGKPFYGACVTPKEGVILTGAADRWETGKIYTVDWNGLPIDGMWAYYLDSSGGYLLHVGGTCYDRAAHPGDYSMEAQYGYAHRGENGKFAGVWYFYRMREAEQPIYSVAQEPQFGRCSTEEDMLRVRTEVQDTLEHLTVWYGEHRE
ncbi:MAG: M28 family peptidase [Clostridia bacterium]|nr:M28 family peptidase [Clostridia bacterium]